MKSGATIETDRLIIRHWTRAQSDIDALHRLNSDEEVMRFYPARRSLDQTVAMLNSILEFANSYGYTWSAVCLKATGAPIGFSGLAPVNNFVAPFCPADEIGWRFLPEYWGKGYASEAAAALLQHAWNDLNKSRIVAFAVSSNKASIEVMKRIGMVANPTFDFDHPNVPDTMPHLKRHSFYEIHRP